MLLQWEEYSRIRYAEKLKVEKCIIPEITKKSGKVKKNIILKLRHQDLDHGPSRFDQPFLGLIPRIF